MVWELKIEVKIFSKKFVLILVFVEDGLGVPLVIKTLQMFLVVLILVFVEDGLGVQYLNLH